MTVAAFWLLVKWSLIVFFYWVFLWAFLAGTLLLVSWIITKLYAKRILGYLAKFPDFFPSVEPIELNGTYRLKLAATTRFFLQEPEIPLPVLYFFLPGVKTPRAYIYIHTEEAMIIFSEAFLQMATEKELAGILAHELAHLEEMYKTGKEERPHWVVDQRAAELTSRGAILCGLQRWIIINECVRKKHRILIFLRHAFTLGGDPEHPHPSQYYDITQRVAILSESALREKRSA